MHSLYIVNTANIASTKDVLVNESNNRCILFKNSTVPTYVVAPRLEMAASTHSSSPIVVTRELVVT